MCLAKKMLWFETCHILLLIFVVCCYIFKIAMKINNITAYCRRGIECHTDSFKQVKCNKPVQFSEKN